MGLGGTAEPTGRMGWVRQEGIPVGGSSVSLLEVAWRALRIDGTTPPCRRPAPSSAPARRPDQGLAVRPDVDGRYPRHREGHRNVLANREALRCPGPAVPAAPGKPQRCGG